MGVPSGANSRPPCASKLCGPVPKYEFPEEGGFSGLIIFSAHSLNRILRPLGLGLPCVGWYQAYLETSKTWASCFIVGSYGLVLASVSWWLELVMKHSPSFVRIMSKLRKSRSVHELKKNRRLSRKCFFRLQRHLEIRCCCCCCFAIITQLFVKPCFYNFIYTT